MVPAHVAERITKELRIPTIGIGAGPHCDAQVMVWTDMAGMNTGPAPRFVKRYADLRGVITDGGARPTPRTSPNGTYPGPEHSFDD